MAEILVSRDRFPGLASLEVSMVGIVTGHHGALARQEGIDLAAALAQWRDQGRFRAEDGGAAPMTALEAVRALDYDVMVELTPLNRADRAEPAIQHVREALGRGRHVVTANKAPLAWAGRELSELARGRGVRFLHEAAVMDGVPVFNLARHGLRGATVSRVEGILNSTTNAILCALERGETLEAALARAQGEGYAEADPRDDLEGWDAAVKVCALANVLMDADLRPESVAREGIDGVDAARVREALSRGRRIKLVAEAWGGGTSAQARVALREVPLGDPFALVSGTSSILRIVTDLAGTIVITGEQPDLRVTA